MNQATSDLLMFQVGPRVYASVVQDIRSIRLLGAENDGDLVVHSALGEPIGRMHGVVVSCGDSGERTLVVDQVLGVRAVEQSDMRPMPAFAAACLRSGAVCGFVLLEGLPTLIVDLPTLVRERSDVAVSSSHEKRPHHG